MNTIQRTKAESDYNTGYSCAAHGLEWADVPNKGADAGRGYRDCNEAGDGDVFGEYRFKNPTLIDSVTDLLPWPYNDVLKGIRE